MQIQLNQAELEQAVRQYVIGMGIRSAIGEIKFTATRGDAGVLTEVEILSNEAPSGPQPRTATAKAANPVVPVGVADNEEEVVEEESDEVVPAITGKSLFGA